MSNNNPIARRLGQYQLQAEDLAIQAGISLRTALLFTRPNVKTYLTRKTSLAIDRVFDLPQLTTKWEWEDFQSQMRRRRK